LVPLSSCRRADSLLTEEEEKAKNGSDEVVESGESSVAFLWKPGTEIAAGSPGG